MKTRSNRSRSRSQSRNPTQSKTKTPIHKIPEKTPERALILKPSKTPDSALKPSKNPDSPEIRHINTLTLKKKSYLDIIKDYIEKEDITPPQTQARGAFTLKEDLKIIYQMAKDENDENHMSNFWKILTGLISRNIESIRSRYKSYLKFLEKEDFDKIIKHLNEKGLHGYMIKFEGDKTKRKFAGIIASDETKKMTSTTKTNLEKPQKIFTKFIDPENYKENEGNANIPAVEEEEKIMNKNEGMNIKWVKHIQKYESVILTNNVSICNKWDQNPNIFHNSDEICEEIDSNNLKILINCDFNNRWCHNRSDNELEIDILDFELKNLSKIYKIEKNYLIDLLTSVSGDISDLKKILENPEEKISLVWMEEDDQVLDICKNESEFAFKMLVRYKGVEKIKNRLLFLNKKLPFELE